MREVETRLRTMAASLASASVLVSTAPRATSRRRSVVATLAATTVCGVCLGGFLALHGSAGGSGKSAHAGTPAASPAPTLQRDVPLSHDPRVVMPLAGARAPAAGAGHADERRSVPRAIRRGARRALGTGARGGSPASRSTPPHGGT